MPHPLRYLAGATAAHILRERGLSSDTVGGIVGTASGPRWLALASLDRALMASGLLDGSAPLLLSGASAGAWRMLALASPRREQVHAELLERYTNMAFPPGVAPATVSAAYREMLAKLFPPGDTATMLSDPRRTIALHVAHARGPAASRRRPLQLLGVLAAGLPRLISSSISRLALIERVIASSRPERVHPTCGRVVQLEPATLPAFALGSGTVPWYMEPVPAPAPLRGRLLDGGLTDYHLREPLGTEGIVLLPHFDTRVLPLWIDQFRRGRRTPAAALDRVLLVCPSAEVLASLPDGKLPDRHDFVRFASDPAERMRRWRLAIARCEHLGQVLLDDLGSGRILDCCEATS